MIVLFDGTSDRQWGKMIFAPQSTQIAAPVERSAPRLEPKETRPRTTDRVRDAKALKGIWFTANEAARGAGISKSQANTVLTNLVETHELVIDRESWPYRYRWASR